MQTNADFDGRKLLVEKLMKCFRIEFECFSDAVAKLQEELDGSFADMEKRIAMFQKGVSNIFKAKSLEEARAGARRLCSTIDLVK